MYYLVSSRYRLEVFNLVVRSAIATLNGEQVVSRSGVYTFIHTYRHFRNGRRVVLCGMLHLGQKDYYSIIKDTLNSCSFILYEPICLDKRTAGFTGQQLDLDSVLDINEFIALEILAYYARLVEVFNSKLNPGFSLEAREFDAFYKRDNWVHADLLPDIHCESETDMSFSDALYKRIARLSKSKKLEVLNFFSSRLLEMDDGTFSVQDFASDIVAIDTNDVFFKLLMSSTMQKKRDRRCFEVFDSVIAQRDPDSIGIKFGVAHIPYQRALLERRGYRLVKSDKICCIHF